MLVNMPTVLGTQLTVVAETERKMVSMATVETLHRSRVSSGLMGKESDLNEVPANGKVDGQELKRQGS